MRCTLCVETEKRSGVETVGELIAEFFFKREGLDAKIIGVKSELTAQNTFLACKPGVVNACAVFPPFL